MLDVRQAQASPSDKEALELKQRILELGAQRLWVEKGSEGGPKDSRHIKTRCVLSQCVFLLSLQLERP